MFYASCTLHDMLHDLAGVSVDAHIRDRVVAAIVETFADEGLILVRRDDLGAYLNQRPGNVKRAAEALNRLLAALSEKNEDIRA